MNRLRKGDILRNVSWVCDWVAIGGTLTIKAVDRDIIDTTKGPWDAWVLTDHFEPASPFWKTLTLQDK